LTLLAIAIIVVAVVVPVYFFIIKKNNDKKPDTGTGTGNGGGPNTGGGDVDGGEQQPGAGGGSFIVGRDGAEVTTNTGAKFTYKNPFGGYFIVDSKNPYNSGARAQEWVPALNETWDFNIHKVRG